MIGGGSSIGGVFSGLVVNASGNWRWVQWMCTILTGTSFLLVLFFLPETNFKRSAESELGEGPQYDENGHEKITWVQSLNVFGGYDR
jgi:MFS family permease